MISQHKKIAFSIPTSARISIHFIVIFLLIGIAIAAFVNIFDNIKVDNSNLDLSAWDYNGTFNLSGTWDYYPDTLLTFDKLKNTPAQKVNLAEGHRLIPGSGIATGYSYATYRLHVTGAQPGKTLALRIRDFAPAYSVYIDNKSLLTSGAPADNIADFVSHIDVQTARFTPSQCDFDIIIQAATTYMLFGCTHSAILLGSSTAIITQNELLIGRDFFLMGSFFIIMVFCTHTYIHRRDRSMLLFAHLCLLFILRTSIDGSIFIRYIFQSISYASVIRINILTLAWLPCLYYYLAYSAFSHLFTRFIGRVLTPLITLISLLILILPARVMYYTILPTYFLIYVIGIYSTVRIVPALRTKRYSKYILTGFIILAACLTRDVLWHLNILKAGLTEYTPLGFFAASVLWTYNIIKRHVNTLDERNQAMKELIKAHESERQTELKFLKSQIRPHFINNALNTIISISRNDPDRARSLLVEFSKYLRSCYDFDNLEDTIPLENELTYVRSYLLLEKARFQDRLNIEYDIDNISISIPPLVLQPLVENAVIHGIRRKKNGGLVRIYVKKNASSIIIGVKDDGCGISPELLNGIFGSDHHKYGVGLNNIDQRLRKIYRAGLQIESSIEGGTNVFMEIPLND